jgi:hypothetical protein
VIAAGVAVQALVLGAEPIGQVGAEVDRERRVGAAVAQIDAAVHRQRGLVEALARHRGPAALDQRLKLAVRGAVRLEQAAPGVHLAVPRHRREPHAPRRHDARPAVAQEGADAERPRQRARVLPTGAAEHDERVAARVPAARDRHLPDRLGHAGGRDLGEAGRQRVGCQ